MKNTVKKPIKKGKKQINKQYDDLFELCIEKGLIKKTEYGYYFKPEFFETLEIYEE
ncbi:MAG: hypothetical protein JSW60_02305 [Thermoplasmatales archaeon]|nr:MAG: hypothetical protein JSW60_02305 [Thermoplasmatales archaeon]